MYNLNPLLVLQLNFVSLSQEYYMYYVLSPVSCMIQHNLIEIGRYVNTNLFYRSRFICDIFGQFRGRKFGILWFLCPRPERVRRGHLVTGSSVRPSVRLFVRPSVCLSVRNSVPLTNKVQYLKFGWWHSNQTWTVASFMGSSHFTDITCPWGLGGVKMLDLKIFAIFWLCCRRGHPCFTNTCLVSKHFFVRVIFYASLNFDKTSMGCLIVKVTCSRKNSSTL